MLRRRLAPWWLHWLQQGQPAQLARQWLALLQAPQWLPPERLRWAQRYMQ
jgi:hypothetical protein